MKRCLLIIAMFFIAVNLSYPVTYYLGVPIVSTNNRPLKDQTIAIYDSSGSTKVQDAYYLWGPNYYVTSPLAGGYYDIKIYIGTSWYTLYNNVWLGHYTMTAVDSATIKALIEDSLEWVHDTLLTDFTDTYLTEAEINAKVSYRIVKHAALICYDHGDTLNSVYLSSSDSLWYSPDLPYQINGVTMTLDSVWMLINGDADTYVDYFKIYSAYGLAGQSTIFNYTTNNTCSGSAEYFKYSIGEYVTPGTFLHMNIKYNVNTSVKTYYFIFFLSG